METNLEDISMRLPSVADQFYPGSPAELSHTLESLLESSRLNAPKSIKAAVAPHAGYVYSGQLAAETLGSAVIPEHVVILGPNHRGTGALVALSSMAWDMVLGKVETDHNLTHSLQVRSDLFTIDDHAHQLEHSLEVQIPILQKLQSNLHITPIVLSHI
jgi:AmmeMemoRadiSam system protein B